MIGHNLFDKDSKKDDGKRGLIGDAKTWVDGKKGDAKDKLNDITGDIADKLAAKLGISQWYSLHIMDSCKGNFAPNATQLGAGLNITNCTSPGAASELSSSQFLLCR